MMPLQSVVQPTIHKKGSHQILLRRFGCSTGDLKSIFLSGALDAKLTKNEIVAWKKKCKVWDSLRTVKFTGIILTKYFFISMAYK